MIHEKPQRPDRTVIEGDLPWGVHPTPGRTGNRVVWTGRKDKYDEVMPGTAVSDSFDPSKEYGATRQLRRGRIIGIDVARGLALFGMFGAHTLNSWNDEADRATVAWMITAGNAAALFAILAGVGISLIAGAGRQSRFTRTERRDRLRVTRGQLAVRAVAILLIGVAANTYLNPPVFNILPYYALLFLLAIPFLGARKRTLLGAAALMAVVGPLIEYVVRDHEPYDRLLSPGAMDVLLHPVDALGTLLFTGTYPVATWIVYVLVGMAVGRLALDRLRVQVGLLGFGSLTALLGWGFSRLLVYYMGGYEAMLYSEVRITQSFLEETMAEGPDPDLPTSSLWWLSISGPHTNTLFSLMLSTGIALAVLGAALLLCRAIPVMLNPVALAGSMTLTLYISHLAFLHFVPVENNPNLAFIVQVAGAVLLAVAWRGIFRQGPLEWSVATISKTLVRPTKQRTAPVGNGLGELPIVYAGRHRRTHGDSTTPRDI